MQPVASYDVIMNNLHGTDTAYFPYGATRSFLPLSIDTIVPIVVRCRAALHVTIVCRNKLDSTHDLTPSLFCRASAAHTVCYVCSLQTLLRFVEVPGKSGYCSARKA